MTIKDLLIRKVANSLSMDEKIVEKIITHQFDSASAATVNNNSIEISGFGKFLFNNKRGIKTLEKYEILIENYTKALETVKDDNEKRVLLLKIKTINVNIAHLKPKLV